MIGQVARPTPGGGRRVAGRRPAGGASAGTDRHHAAVPRRRTSSHPAARRPPSSSPVVAVAVAAIALALSLGDDERAPALTRAELSAEAFADSMGVVDPPELRRHGLRPPGRGPRAPARARRAPRPRGDAHAARGRARRRAARAARPGRPGHAGHRRPERPAGARGRGRADRSCAGASTPSRAPTSSTTAATRPGPCGCGPTCPRCSAAVRTQAPGVPLIGPSFISPGEPRPASATCPGSSTATPTPAASPRSPSSAPRSASWAPGAAAPAASSSRRPATTTRSRDLRTQPPVTEAVAAVYLPRGSTPPPSAPACGGRSSTSSPTRCPSPALRDAQQHFGLLRADLTPEARLHGDQDAARRPAPLARAPGAARAAGLGAAGRRRVATATSQRLVLVRRDGSHVLVLWRAVSVWDRDRRLPLTPAPLGVRLHFDRPARDVAVWRPSTSTGPGPAPSRRPRRCRCSSAATSWSCRCGEPPRSRAVGPTL